VVTTVAEALTGDRRGQHSIRVNDQYRICFVCRGGDADDVEIVDYHSRREGMMAKARRLPPVHPGEVLREDLMTPLGLSISGLARDLRVPVTRMSEIVNGRRRITADTALRFARYFAMTPEFWMNLQAAYDLDLATHASADRIKRDVREAA
jgi:addiction module HigA family antidote